jgi:hypothetical protein
MNYTKFLRKSDYRSRTVPGTTQEEDQFQFLMNDEKLKICMRMGKEIRTTKRLLDNYHRLDFKIDLDEYMCYFLKEKNTFLDEMKKNIEKSSLKEISK